MSKPLVYSSPAITARRRRILKETRKIIAESGMKGLTIRALCRRADVSQYTIYNAFENKNQIIAAAIKESYDNLNQNSVYIYMPDTMEGNIERLITVNMRNLKHGNYAKAISNIYFSSNMGEDVILMLREMGFSNLRQWLDKIEEDQELGCWVNRADLEIICVNGRYAIIND